MRSSNPALSPKVFEQAQTYGFEQSNVMTVEGTVIKTCIALALLMCSAGWTMYRFAELGGMGDAVNPPNPAAFGAIMPFMIGGLVAGLILCLVTMFKPTVAHITTPLYAIAEGFLIGGLSAFVNSQFPQENIAFQAALLTFGVLALMLVAYGTGVIKVTEKLRTGIIVATGAIGLLYLVSIGLRFVGMEMPFIHSSGPMGIAFSLFVVGLAAFNLLLDFDLIDRGTKVGAPKYMEWYAAFALMVTLIWLYIEILRLLSKLKRR